MPYYGSVNKPESSKRSWFTGNVVRSSIILVAVAALFGASFWLFSSHTYAAVYSAIFQIKPASSTKSPNVVVIMVDDMGFDDIGIYNTDITSLTPNINSLAQDGVVLTHYYTMQLCTPSRSSFLTGSYAHKLGMQFNNIHPMSTFGLPLTTTIMSNKFSDLGYKTHIVGKWNQGHYMDDYLPTNRGFDSFYGFMTDQIDYMTHEYPTKLSGSYYKDFVYMESGSDDFSFVNASGNYSLSLFKDRISTIISDHDTDDSLFLYFASQGVHGPLPTVDDSLLSDSQLEYLIDDVVVTVRRKFLALVAGVDDIVGEIVSGLQDKGMYEDTVFIFASDNGGCFEQGGLNVPFKGGKQLLFEGGLRTPAFMTYPALVDDDDDDDDDGLYSTYSDMFHVTDWMPTIMEAVGHAYDDDDDSIDGMSHWEELKAHIQMTSSSSVSTFHPRAIASAASTTTSSSVRSYLPLYVGSYQYCCEESDGTIYTGDEFDFVASSCSGVIYACTTSNSSAALLYNNVKWIQNEYDAYFETTADIANLNYIRTKECSDSSCISTSYLTSFIYDLSESAIENGTNYYNDEEAWTDTIVEAMEFLKLKLAEEFEAEVASEWAGNDVKCTTTWTDDYDGYIGPWE